MFNAAIRARLRVDSMVEEGVGGSQLGGECGGCRVGGVERVEGAHG